MKTIIIKNSADIPVEAYGVKRESSVEVRGAVAGIIADVRTRGDAAVLEYTKNFDRCTLTPGTLMVTDAEMDAAYSNADKSLIDAMSRSITNIRAFHAQQKERTWLDITPKRTLGQLVTPLTSVGVYVPGGRAAYPSSVLMTVIPAQVAGVERIAMCTPPDAQGNVSQNTLVAARLLGVNEIYKLGGAQAVAAMAYGSETVGKVDKIVGPGNAYVAEAKRAVYGDVGIDMVAGPSEVLIVADASADPRFITADLLSQAEHDPDASAVLVTDCEALAKRIPALIEEYLINIDKNGVARQSIQNNGKILLVDNIKEAMRCANALAPEHLELMVDDPDALLLLVRNAGAVFIGAYTPEPVGDYFAGPNHVLPTAGTARFSSPLGVYDFIKRSSVLKFSKDALMDAMGCIDTLAVSEGLPMHARAVNIRGEG